jgi:hypothetical protein
MSDIEKAYGGLVPATLLINNTTLINSVVIEYKSIFDFNVKLQTLQNFLQTIELMARLLGSDYAQAAISLILRNNHPLILLRPFH